MKRGFAPLEISRSKRLPPCRKQSGSLTGFTLIELLIVVGILAAIATVTVLILNPVQFIAQGRDSTRMSDLQNLNKAISLSKATDSFVDSTGPKKVYVSLPDTNSILDDDCKDSGEYPTLPALATGWEYRCVADSANLRNIDSTGWIPINFSSIQPPLATLPVDPINNSTNLNYYAYGYDTDQNDYAISAKLDSDKLKEEVALNDGGNDDTAFETRPAPWYSIVYSAVPSWTKVADTIVRDITSLSHADTVNKDIYCDDFNCIFWTDGGVAPSGTVYITTDSNVYANILWSKTDSGTAAWGGEKTLLSGGDIGGIHPSGLTAGKYGTSVGSKNWLARNYTSNPGTYYAMDVCKAKGFAWRLPNILELDGVRDMTTTSYYTRLPNLGNWMYWSSSRANAEKAYGLYLYDNVANGDVQTIYIWGSYEPTIRCVYGR